MLTVIVQLWAGYWSIMGPYLLIVSVFSCRTDSARPDVSPRKGGVNAIQSQITDRPPAPSPLI